MLELIGYVWNEALIRPMMNGLVLLYFLFFSNFGLSIIGFTIIVRLIMVPLTVKQGRQMKALSALQPKLKEIQSKYSDDKQKASQETMKMYREHGVNPLGCLGPLVIQMPIFFGLFWALRGTLPSTPERLADLASKLYSWLPFVHETVPLNGTFLWMDLAVFAGQNTLPFLLPVLVGGSMWMMQKMTPTASATPQQESTNRMMLWMMPLMFGFFTLSFEAGLALYWIVSNLVGIAIQGFITGWEPLRRVFTLRPTVAPAGAPALVPSDEDAAKEEAATDDRNRNDSKDGRRSNRARSKGARRRARGSRNRRR